VKGLAPWRAAAIAALASIAACASAPREDRVTVTTTRSREVPAPEERPAPGPLDAALPDAPGPLAPSEARLEGKPRGASIADVATCEGCHADVAAQWRTSAHAFASFNNPVYRVSVDRFRAEAGPAASRHCGGCHDPALLADGLMDRATAVKDGLAAPPADPTDRRARAGVTCRTCHGVVEARPDGNGSYTLAAADIPLPTDGDPESLRLHKERAAPAPLRTAALCGACHRAFLDTATGNAHFLAGADELTAWMRSAYAGDRLYRVDDDVPEKDCRGCHMPREDATSGDAAAKGGKVASHRFLGGHTWLAAMRGDGEQLERARAAIRGAASVDVAAVVHGDGSRSLPADGAPVAPGEDLVLDVVVKNQRAGHRFPGGTLDAQDTWIEVTVDDARGGRIAAAGIDEESTGADPSAHVLRALIAGEDGVPLFEREVNRFRAVVANHTVLPRDAEVTEYAFRVPEALDAAAFPLRVTARLRHRSRALPLQRAACEEARTPWGRASHRVQPLDACAPQPVTDVAETEAWIGPGAAREAPAGKPPVWQRLLDHAYGLSHAVQERLDEARPSLDRALAEAKATGSARAEARVVAALAWLEAHEGRCDEALRQADRAEALSKGHPAIAYVRGDALAQVWRWAEAAGPLAEAAEAAPGDDSAWMRLAVGLGSRGGDDRGALAAAARGLRLQPRDADMLRVEALALGALGDADAARRAEKGYEEVRQADGVPRVRAKCSAKVPGCALERTGVHVHRMVQAR
jgi:tetratricopeptide (TPR) repeat protein